MNLRRLRLPRTIVCVSTLAVAVAAAGDGPAGQALPALQPVSVAVSDGVDGPAPLQLPAFWSPAATRQPAPALVLLHGCSGLYGRGGQPAERYRAMAAWLNQRGIHALATDSFSPRGERQLCTQRTGSRRVTMRERRRDALAALQWLAKQPEVDAARVGLLGWSNGGSTVLAASNRRHAEVAAAAVRPALAVAYYPGCQAEVVRGYDAVAPVLLLTGGADDWTPAAACEALARSAAGATVDIEVYAGAHHGFDGRSPVRHRTDVPGGVRPGEGVHVGADPAARAAATRRLERFLREHWSLP